jgi:hypothetical protein
VERRETAAGRPGGSKPISSLNTLIPNIPEEKENSQWALKVLTEITIYCTNTV